MASQNKRKVIITIFIVLLFIGLGVAFLLVRSKSTNESSNTAVQTTQFRNKQGEQYKAVNACTLLSVEELSEKTSESMTADTQYYADTPTSTNGKPVVSDNYAYSTCAYVGEDIGKPVVQLTVVSPASNTNIIADEYEKDKSAASTKEYYEELNNYGEDAYWSDDESTMYILKSGHVIKIYVGEVEDPEVGLVTAKSIAEVVTKKQL